MARGGKRRSTTEPSVPLPPERRNVGQLIAETIRLYGANFFRALPLGLVVATANQFAFDLSREETTAVFVAAAPFFTVAYVYAARIVTQPSATARSWIVAVAVGTLVFLPAAVTFAWFALASVLWLALAGLAAPAALVEARSFLGAFRRGFQLGRADFVHAAGSLAALVVLFALSRQLLALLLESQAENTVRTAIFLADTVLGPLLFLGGALLYVDQEARLRSHLVRGKERDAHLSHADEAHGEGSPDTPRQSRPPA
jgi:hypothetical protein